MIPWIIVMLWFGFSSANNLENSTMYLMAKSDRDARGMAVIPLLGSLIGPPIFFVPPLVAIVTHPGLAGEFTNLKQPHEAAFVAVARDVMPQGLIGLLLCAMLGATLTNMDAAVNKGVGVFVRSFFKPILAPNASDRSLLLTSKGCTLAFGANHCRHRGMDRRASDAGFVRANQSGGGEPSGADDGSSRVGPADQEDAKVVGMEYGRNRIRRGPGAAMDV